MSCPYYTNKSVGIPFNDTIEALGGSRLSDEEFRSADLRSLRSGLEYSAMELTYTMFDKNNGNTINLAPNGKLSGLFLDLLDITENYADAIRFKARIFMNDFKGTSRDINGEPLVSELVSRITPQFEGRIGEIINKFGLYHQLRQVDVERFFGELLKTLNSGDAVSSSDIMKNLLNINAIPHINKILSQVLLPHDIPVLFGDLEFGKPMEAIQKNGGTVIIIDYNQIRDLSEFLASNLFMHEIVHALTTSAIDNPKSGAELAFRKALYDIYKFYDNLIDENLYARFDSYTGALILKDVYEFAAEFATNRRSRDLLYRKAILADKEANGKARYYIKKFINKLSNMLCKKQLFDLKSDEFVRFKNQFDNFLLHRTVINKGDITDLEMFNAVYLAMDVSQYEKQKAYERRSALFNYLDDYDRHAATLTPELKKLASKAVIDLRSEIATMLNLRLLAIKGTRAIPAEKKITYTEVTNTQVSNLLNSELNAAQALASLYALTVPQLLEDIIALKQNDDMTEALYMFNMHNNFATYNNIFSSITSALAKDNVMQYLKEEVETLPQILRDAVISGLNTLLLNAANALYVSLLGIGYMQSKLADIFRRVASEICDETESEELSQWLSEFEEVGYDINKMVSMLGAKQNSKDKTVKAIIHLINGANSRKRKQFYKRINELTRAKNMLKSGEKLTDLYETDSSGNFTSYLIRSLNYGEAYFKYQEFIEKVNKLYGLDKKNRTVPDSEQIVTFKSFFENSKHEDEKMTMKKAWNIHKNEFLSRNYERLYKEEYYEAYANLSDFTLEALLRIRNRINDIKLRAVVEGTLFYDYSKLTDEEWHILRGLWIERRLLSSFYTFDGSKKDPASREYKIAEEIQKLNEELYSSDEDYHDTEAWLEARNNKLLEVTEKYDGLENAETKINEEMAKWDSRNSRVSLKKIGERAILWDFLDDLIEQRCHISKADIVYDIGDGGLEYENNKERISNILNMYRDQNTGEVDLDFLPKSAQAQILKIEKRNSDIRIIARHLNKGLRAKEKAYRKAQKEVYNEYIRFPKTKQYIKMFGSSYQDDVKGKLPRWATKVEVIKDRERFVQVTPGDGWVKREDRKDLINPEFERLLQMQGNEGMHMIPKESLYKNEKFELIQKSDSLMNLYNLAVQTIKESNNNYFDENNIDTYRLPQITGTMYDYMLVEHSSGAGRYIKEQFGIVDDGQGIRQDDSYGASVDLVLDDPDEFLRMLEKEGVITAKNIHGTSADGREFSVVPKRFVAPLNNPALISRDLIGILGEYYNASLNFKEKDLIKDKVEVLIDVLSGRVYNKTSKTGEVVKLVKGKDTTAYLSARKAADMFLYGQLTDLIRPGNVEYSKALTLGRKATTAVNLGLNPAVAITGFFSSLFAHTVNAIVRDQNYGIEESITAIGINAWDAIKTGFGLTEMSSNNTNNKTIAWMELFNLVNQADRKYKKSHHSRLYRFFSDNYTYGMLTGMDFMIKSNIMTTMLLGHRLYKGRFVSKQDIFYESLKDKNAMQEWKAGIRIWDAVDLVDGEIVAKKEYEEAVDKSLDTIYERVIYVAEKADGVATETQKAEITTNWLGAAALIHRQYLPLLWQDRLCDAVFNEDTRSYQMGSFVTWRNFIWTFWKKAIMQNYIAKRAGEDSNIFKQYMKLSKDYLSYYDLDGELKSRRLVDLARHRRKHLWRVGTEFALSVLLFDILAPLIFGPADDPDKKDELMYQFAAYVARRVEWETMNQYNPSDVIANIRTVSAETSLIDKTVNAVKYGGKGLYSLLSSDESLSNELIYQSGVYKGKNKAWVSLFKLLAPAHNTWEQYYGSRAKRRYYEYRVMDLDPSDRWELSLVYNIAKYLEDHNNSDLEEAE